MIKAERRGKKIVVFDTDQPLRVMVVNWRVLFELIQAFASREEDKRRGNSPNFEGYRMVRRFVYSAAYIHRKWETMREWFFSYE